MIGAIEAGGTKFVLALADPAGTMIDKHVIPTRTPQQTFAEMNAWFEAAAARAGRVLAFGIGSFGPIELDPTSKHYTAYSTTPKPGWSGASLREALARFDAPLNLETDVNAAAIGEWQSGAGRGSRSLAYTTIGTGIGSGILKDGAVLSGWSHYESGHLLVRRDAVRDPFAGVCRYHGDCLEGLASGPAIKARWGHDLSAAGDAQVALVADYAAQLAASLVLLHRPERLIFGGGVMKARGMVEHLRVLTRDKLAGYIAEWDEDLTDRIVTPGLGDDAGIIGAIELGRRVLENA